MNKLIILVFWMLAHILLYCAHIRLMDFLPTLTIMVSSTALAIYLHYKTTLHFGNKLMN
jgi:hypothetical protein